MTFLIYLTFYILIISSTIGYGILTSKLILNYNNNFSKANLGYIGILGFLTLCMLSYVANFIIPQSIIFNSFVLSIGLISFLLFLKYLKKDIYILIGIFLVLFIALLGDKNHDDFFYYHFPYSLYLSNFKLILGIGKLSHGFRTPSSLFYYHSLTYLPFIKYYLFNLGPLIIMGFCNFILLKNILEFKNKKIDFIFHLNSLSLIFINIFFYRLAEHGTDRSAQILIFILVINLLSLNNFNKYNFEKIVEKTVLVIICIVSLKAFYLIYFVFIFPLFYWNKNKNLYEILFKSRLFLFVSFFLILILSTYFFNTGCFLYPAKFTCFETLWSINKGDVQLMQNWYELWSKGGAGPNFRIENPELYIQKFNWIDNWINIYFFNKVSDFIFGIFFLCFIYYLFLRNFKKKIEIRRKWKITYLIIFFLFLEWFYNHPALRYGGFSLIALLIFIPVCINLEKYLFPVKIIKKRNIYFVFNNISNFYLQKYRQDYK